MFADKAAGYGLPGVTLDGTDPDRIAAAFSWAAERARGGDGPVLLELVAMRMCGHAHHDDMLYLGKEPPVGWDYPEPSEAGYVDRDAYRYWADRDPLSAYAERLLREGVVVETEIEQWKRETQTLVDEEAAAVVEAPWPSAEDVGKGVYAGDGVVRHREPLNAGISGRLGEASSAAEDVRLLEERFRNDPAPEFDPKGRTFLESIMLGVGDALREDPRAFVYGEDVGGRYGNAFLLLRPLLEEFPGRIVNSPLSEGGVLGACIGAALAGARPIGEIHQRFRCDRIQSAREQRAKIRYRWGGEVPMVVRMPWGRLALGRPVP